MINNKKSIGFGYASRNSKNTIVVYSSEGEESYEEYVERRRLQSEQSPQPAQIQQPMQSQPQRTNEEDEGLDPLIQSLTKMDSATANAPTRNLPLIGEVPIDSSLVVLAPAAVLGVLGFLMSINIAFQSRDVFVEGLEQMAQEMSKPPVKESVVKDACRGLCSNQEDQLNSMRGFMESLSSKNKIEAVAVEEEAMTTTQTVIEDKTVSIESAATESEVSSEKPVVGEGSTI